MMRILLALVVALATCSSAAAFSAAPASRACASRASSVSMGPQDFKGKKYGVPVFLPDGNVNPKYIAAEAAEKAKARKANNEMFAKRKAKLNAKKIYDIADYIKGRIAPDPRLPKDYFPGKNGL
eukprot:CAMPEP_0119405564 /NCGR_PEP_ID=MMETSP1335-20130426/115_1 /TAXON_ID=259385 /ORGANISM="Chrysoculter rhomboideus, Strain RCC1486" /LENGTH=123 /DNA_ID=CAMNT_0007429559 /DNA_START=47 /DNA_END=418 /DNA_ORIENTATION=-